MTIKIENITLGKSHKPFIIAEMSGNHNQSLERALEIVDAAAVAGVHALKLQTYTADTMTIEGIHTISEEGSLWKGRELYDLYKEAYTPWDWHKPIFEKAREKGLIIFSSPFDETAVDFLEELDVPCYKIASFENNDHPLLVKVAKTGKPVIMSTGVASMTEIEESVDVLKQNGCRDIILLKCTSTYPASPENTNLVTIPVMQELFQDCIIGLSDHTMGIGVAVTSVGLGARVIEKHFTLNRADGGVDSAFSMEPDEMQALVVESERAFLALGNVQLTVQSAEEKNKLYKRSIYVVKDIQAGEIFTKENIRVIRPGNGLEPKHYNNILGRRAIKSLTRGTPFQLDFVN